MVSSSSSSSSYPKPKKNKNKKKSLGFETSPQLENSICVHVDPSNFRDVVQKLTGASTDPMVPTVQKLPIAVTPQKLPELRQNPRNLQLQPNQNGLSHEEWAFAPRKRVIDAWPMSTLDTYLVQEEIAIANKGFYLYPSPEATSGKAEPQLLPLFPTSPDS